MRIPAIALVLLVAGHAQAQNADLEMYLDWVQIEGTTTVKFTLVVENVSPTGTFDPGSGAAPVDVLLYPHLDHKPDAEDGGSCGTCQLLLDTVLPPGAKWTQTINYDFEEPGSYQAWAIVDSLGYILPDLGYPETTKANNIDGPVPVTVEGSVILEADLVCTLQAQVVGGTQAIFEVVVQNIGSIAAPDCFKVDVLYDSPTCPPPEWGTVPNTKFGDVFASVSGGLAAGETKEIIFPNTSVPPGTHVACALVDLDDCIDETDDIINNVCGPVEYTIEDIPDIPQCDLDVTVFTISTLLDEVTYKAEVKNIGDKACPGFTVDLWFNSPEEPTIDDLSSHFWIVSSLAVNDIWQDEFVREAAPNGGYNAWVWADPDNVSKDKFAGNNLVGPFPYTVAVPSDNPDMLVVDVEWTEVADQICFDVTVRNAGTSDAVDFPVTIFYSWPTNPNCFEDDLATAVSDETTVTLAPGAQQTLTFCWEAPTDGEHIAWVKLDCLNAHEEADETNNDYPGIVFDYEQVLAEGVDIRALDFKAKVTCTLVSFSGVCRNAGDKTANPFQIDIFYDSETNPSFNPPGDFTLFHPAEDPDNPENLLAPGEDVPVSHNRTFDSGTYRSWFVCDTNNDVDEDNEDHNAEGNNIAFVEYVVDQAGCACDDNIQIDDPCSCAGETVFEGYCCNDEWGFASFDECEEDATTDTTDTGNDDGTDAGTDEGDTTGEGVVPGEGAQLSHDVTTNATTAAGEGCSAGPNGAGSAALIVFMALSLLGVIRRRMV